MEFFVLLSKFSDIFERQLLVILIKYVYYVA